MWPLDTWGSNFFPMYIKKQKIYSCMKQKVSTVPKGTLSILGSGLYRKRIDMWNQYQRKAAKLFILSLEIFVELKNILLENKLEQRCTHAYGNFRKGYTWVSRISQILLLYWTHMTWIMIKICNIIMNCYLFWLKSIKTL